MWLDVVSTTSREALEEVRAALREQPADRDLREVADQLFAAAGLLAREVPLRRALTDPALPVRARRELVAQLLGAQVGEATLAVLQAGAGARWTRPVDLTDALEVVGAEAAFVDAERRDRLDEVEDELFRFDRIVDREPDLRAALSDPVLPRDRLQQLLDALLEDKVDPVTRQLLGQVVASRGRRALSGAVGDLLVIAARMRERLLADVRSAVPLSAEQTRRLAAALRRIYGREVQLQVAVDPAVIGGLVVRVGDELIDGSIARRLDETRRRLVR